MSNSIFPTLPGLAWDIVRTPVWQTRRQQSVSGRVTTQADWQYPLYKLQLTYEFLRSDAPHAELQTLIGFYNQMNGGFDTFLFSDPEDNSVSNQPVGLGDGSTVAFQLVRSYGGFVEPMYAVAGMTALTVGGIGAAGYSVSATGILTLAVPPAAGAEVVAGFVYYRRCRFSDDTVDFNNFMYQLHECKQLNLETVR